MSRMELPGDPACSPVLSPIGCCVCNAYGSAKPEACDSRDSIISLHHFTHAYLMWKVLLCLCQVLRPQQQTRPFWSQTFPCSQPPLSPAPSSCIPSCSTTRMMEQEGIPSAAAVALPGLTASSLEHRLHDGKQTQTPSSTSGRASRHSQSSAQWNQESSRGAAELRTWAQDWVHQQAVCSCQTAPAQESPGTDEHSLPWPLLGFQATVEIVLRVSVPHRGSQRY